MTLRILVTGSRDWTDRTAIRRALLAEIEQVANLVQLNEVLVIHGAQGTYRNGVLVKGTDMLTDEEAKKLGMRTDPHPADWHGPCRTECKPGHRRTGWGEQDYCPAAGNYRNQEMVDLVPCAGMCLAFPLRGSVGTWDCVQRAKRAGIPTRIIAASVVTL